MIKFLAKALSGLDHPQQRIILHDPGIAGGQDEKGIVSFGMDVGRLQLRLSAVVVTVSNECHNNDNIFTVSLQQGIVPDMGTVPNQRK